VVEAVLNATFEELVRVGFSGLRVEEVAARAGVNKTTVYRRWPTKLELVSSAYLSPRFLGVVTRGLEDTGSLRGDLVAFGLGRVRLADVVEGRAGLRMGLLERSNPELSALAERVSPLLDTAQNELVNRIRRRVELPPERDVATLVEAFAATLLMRALTPPSGPTEAEIEHLIDVLFYGLVPPREGPTPDRPRRAGTRGTKT
jgi:AcrR family transcriptional regulator